MGQGYGSGSLNRKRWKRLNFYGSGSTLKKKLEAEANSEATYIIHTWKRKQKYSILFQHIPDLKALQKGVFYAQKTI